MWNDKVYSVLGSPITGIMVAIIIAALQTSGVLSVYLFNILLVLLFVFGCFRIFRIEQEIHLCIISCLFLGIVLTPVSWWIKSMAVTKQFTTKQPTATEIASEVKKILSPGLIAPNKTGEPTFKEKIETISVSFGGGYMIYPISFLKLQTSAVEPINFGGYKPIQIYLDNGELFVDVSVYGGSHQAPIEIKHNEFTIRIPGVDRNFDSTALEIVNNTNSPIFQLIYKTPSQIIINGIFPSPSGLVLASEDGLLLRMPTIPKSFRINRLFKYPSNQFPRQREEIVPIIPSPLLKQRALRLSEELLQFTNERENRENNVPKAEVAKVVDETGDIYDSRFAIKCSDIAEELGASGINVGQLPSRCRVANNRIVMKMVAEQIKTFAESLP